MNESQWSKTEIVFKYFQTNMMKLPRLPLASAALCLALTASAAPIDPLQSGFLNPPDAAKPQTWWHWMNGNITKEGITADLEAMKQVGLGGATIVNVDCDIPSGPVAFMSPEWREDFKFAVQEANRLGLKLCVENCAGWSSSGGPWNNVTNAMQRLTSSEARAEGPVVFNAVLPQPPTTLGYYRDIAVFAFKAPLVEVGTASEPALPAAKLEIKSAVYGAEGGGGSADVKDKIVALIKSGQKSILADNTEMGGDPAFGQVKQLHVEFTLDGKPGDATVDEGDTLVLPVNAGQMAAIHSFGKSSVNRTFVQPPPAIAAAGGNIPREGILDLTAKLAADGRLHWDVPPGSWIILRLGYTPTGVNNHPAPREGTGLECDKLSKVALDAHWAGFMQKILDDIGPLAGKSLDTSLIDSYEVGDQDWTANFREEFKKRRGYDPLPFLPAFTRRIVDNPAVTERFCWDMRRTVADLFAENYFGHFAQLCRQHGLLNAVEPYTGPFESLQCGAPADVVMGEFWTGSQGHPSVKMAASIAHIYGKSIVAAESFTAAPEAGRWQNDPYALKTLGDLMYCQGLNRYVFHRYAMQPWTNHWPGMTMGQWGFHFERTETWWQQGKSWIDYISHCEFLLQQGRAVADVAYFTGESAPVEMRVGNPALPAGYDYDAINADVLLHGATVKNGRITLTSGANYAALILPPGDSNMTPQLLQRIRKLVRAGATVVGPRPQHSPSLADFPKCDAEVKKLADELWGKCDGAGVQENADGKGRIVWGKPLTDVFASQNLKPDFEFQGVNTNTRLAYVHRIAAGADIYFVSNQRRQFDSAECTFRVSGKTPEFWHPDTGMIESAPVWSAQNGRTTVPLNLDPAGSVFVIFRHGADRADHVVAVNSTIAAESIASPKLEIQQAVYAAIDGTGEINVTAKISELARDGQLVVPVNNDVLDHDPAASHEKELRVDYTLDGKPGHATVHENDTLTLSATATTGQSPHWETSVAKDGSPVIKVWSNGQVELRTAAGTVLHAAASNVPAPQEITGPWNLNFPPNWGAPPSVTLENLISWINHTNDGVRYFSGTATYEKDVEIGAERLNGGRELWLDLGELKNFAEVSLNGQNLGVLWKPPFRVNVTAAAKPGMNKLVVKVTNLWPNRLIGDEQLPPDCEWDGRQLKAWPQWLLDGKPSPSGRLTFTTWHHWTKDAPLLDSGLLGPVTLRTSEVIPAR
ncbi:MAG: putative glycosylhydrolase [Pedosphaera sp.]|nr:putative glycosylhydrolase [Pedosphaera sp.]